MIFGQNHETFIMIVIKIKPKIPSLVYQNNITKITIIDFCCVTPLILENTYKTNGSIQ